MSSWDAVGDVYAASYDSLCAGTLDPISEFFGDARGRTLCDVGAGVGTLAGAFGARGWQVTAVEPSRSMREVAQARFPQLRIANESLPNLTSGDAEFDAVTANFVLNHVADPRRAAAELLRVVKPGGVIAATIWSSSPSGFWGSVFSGAGIDVPSTAKLPIERDFDRSAAGLRTMLREAGWEGVTVREHSWDWQVTKAGLWRGLEGGVASAGALYESLTSVQQGAVASAFERECRRFSSGAALRLPHTAAIAQLRRL